MPGPSCEDLVSDEVRLCKRLRDSAYLRKPLAHHALLGRDRSLMNSEMYVRHGVGWK